MLSYSTNRAFSNTVVLVSLYVSARAASSSRESLPSLWILCTSPTATVSGRPLEVCSSEVACV